MIKINHPTALNMPEQKKSEILDAVYDAIGILTGKANASRECWSESWKTTKRATTHTILMVNNSHKYIDVGISLIIGSSQQRRRKRYSRSNDVWRESWRIANQTGADLKEVRKLYLELMSQYVEDDL